MFDKGPTLSVPFPEMESVGAIVIEFPPLILKVFAVNKFNVGVAAIVYGLVPVILTLAPGFNEVAGVADIVVVVTKVPCVIVILLPELDNVGLATLTLKLLPVVGLTTAKPNPTIVGVVTEEESV